MDHILIRLTRSLPLFNIILVYLYYSVWAQLICSSWLIFHLKFLFSFSLFNTFTFTLFFGLPFLCIPKLLETIPWVSFVRISIFWVCSHYLLSHSSLSFTQQLSTPSVIRNVIIIIGIVIVISITNKTSSPKCGSQLITQPMDNSRLSKQLKCACCGCCSCFTSFLNEIKVFAMINFPLAPRKLCQV